MQGLLAKRNQSALAVAPRRIILRTQGLAHGPITRLVSPSDVGALIKPFVFLDAFDLAPMSAPLFGWHPHSGIATLTVVLEGQVTYEETTGVKGVISAGGVEWMRAGGGVWHTGGMADPNHVSNHVKGFQLWVALPPELENGSSESRYLAAEEIASEGPARVLLGRMGTAASAISAPAGISYLDVKLEAGERWTYETPPGETVGWIAVHEGLLHTPEPVSAGELAVFEASDAPIHFEARSPARFILGSAVKHPHDLVLGHYSVHTSRAALMKGETEIARIGATLRAQGRLQNR